MIKSISQRRRSELPGLRGFSETNLKNMRLFYEAWNSIEVKSSVTTDNFHQKTVAEADTFRQLQLTNLRDFPIVSFLSISFTHHIAIITNAKDLQERLFYIQYAAENKVNVDEFRLFAQQIYIKK